MSDQPLLLYQLYISHYCEKARWALDYKGLRYRVINLLPGPHIKTARALSGQTSLPILVHDDHAVNDSSAIISYLDERFPQNPLTPNELTQRRAALEWEKFADEEIGPHVRRICYHVLLDDPKTVLPLFTTGGPWYGPLMMKLAFSRLRVVMRRHMNISAASAKASAATLDAALDKLAARLADRAFLAGDQFSRADLAVSALLAPLFVPRPYLPTPPSPLPVKWQEISDRYADRIGFAQAMYAAHRPGPAH